MKLRDATVYKGMTVNLGNYNSHKAEIGMTVVFDDGDDPETCLTKLITLVNSRLANEINQITSEKPTQPANTPKAKQTLMEQKTPPSSTIKSHSNELWGESFPE